MLEKFKKYLLYKEHKSLSTIETYSRYIQKFINWYYSNTNKKLLKLDNEIIDSYKEHLISINKEKKATISVELSALAKFNSFFFYKNSPKNYISGKKHRNVNYF